MRTSVRIALLAGLLALAANLAIIGLIHLQTYDQSEATLRRQVTQQAHVLSYIYRSGGLPALKSGIDETVDPDDPQAAAAVMDHFGHLIYGNFLYLPASGETLEEGYRTGLIRLQGEPAPHEAGVYFSRLPRGQWVASARIAGEGLALRDTLERSLLLGVALSLLLGIVCGIVVARYVGLRVRAISEVAARIRGGDMEQRIPVRQSGDAFATLGQQINSMLDRIGRLMDELRMLTDTLAHDLRSPVGRLRSAAEAAVATDSPKERDQLLGKVIQESDSLMRILTTVLEIGRSESLAGRKQFASFNAGELGAELVEMYEPVAEEAGAFLLFDTGGGNLEFVGHRQLLAQALSNLVENAVNYAAQGGAITLFVRRSGDRLLLGVSDCGPGIPPNQREQACRRFGRLDASRSRGGAGLGLTLVRAIAHLHSGELVLDDGNPGLVAMLDLAVAPAVD